MDVEVRFLQVHTSHRLLEWSGVVCVSLYHLTLSLSAYGHICFLITEHSRELYNHEAKTVPEKSNIGITISYESHLNLASYKVSDFDTVVSENEHFEVHSKAFSHIKKEDRSPILLKIYSIKSYIQLCRPPQVIPECACL